MASPFVRVLTIWNTSGVWEAPRRSGWVGGVEIWGCWTRTGLTRTVSTSIMKLSWWIPITKLRVPSPHHRELNWRRLQIRRDPRINWIVNPVHKRREARGLTSIGKQVRPRHRLQTNSTLILCRIVDWARAIATIILPLVLLGRNTTLSVFADTVDFCNAFLLSSTVMYRIPSDQFILGTMRF